MKEKKIFNKAVCAAVSTAITICSFNFNFMTVYSAESWDGNADTSWYNTSASEFTLTTPDQLTGLSKLVNEEIDNFAGKTIYLGAYIDFHPGEDSAEWTNGKNIPEKSWQPIGLTYATPFKGTFDGCGYTISGVYSLECDNVAGFFGYIGSGSEIKNFTLDNSYIYALNRYAGGICAYNNYAQITNCQNNAKVCSDYYISGGITGVTIGGCIQKCGNNGSISGGKGSGGITGECIYSNLSECYNSGRSGSATASGGICGYIDEGSINNVYNIGEVYGRAIAGGITGSVKSSSKISNSYNIGNVKSDRNQVGGISGEKDIFCENCYYLDSIANNDFAENSSVISHETLIGNLSSKLGEAFINGEQFPILAWQNNQVKPPVTTESTTESTTETTVTTTSTTATTTTTTTSTTINTSIPAYSLGDCDGNQKISIEDATAVLQYYACIAAGLEPKFSDNEQLNMLSRYAADTNRNGRIDIDDAVRILRYYACIAAGLKPDWNEN